MNNQHPLTDEKAFKKFWDYTVDADLMGQVFYTPDGIRAAADWQLERVVDWLRNELDESYIESPREKLHRLIEEGADKKELLAALWADVMPPGIDVEEVIIDLKQAMRPQEDSKTNS